MDIIRITIPLSDQELDKYFEEIDQFAFVIDYNKCEYKNKLLLNYVYNSGMTCDIEFKELNEDVTQLLVEYIKYKKQFNIPVLDSMWNDVIAYYLETKCIDKKYGLFLDSFVEKNKDLVEELISVLFCLKLYLVNIIICDSAKIEDCQEKKYILLGENFIAIRNDPKFWLNIALLDGVDLPVYNYSNFEEMSFEGRKISHYFLNEFSPFAMLMQLKKESEEATCR